MNILEVLTLDINQTILFFKSSTVLNGVNTKESYRLPKIMSSAMLLCTKLTSLIHL